MNDLDQLPVEIIKKLMGFLNEVDGEYQVKDMKGFVDFVCEYGSKYPVLQSLIKVNEEALNKHYEETGEVPPGVKLIKTTREEGSNVIGLEIVYGSKPSKNT